MAHDLAPTASKGLTAEQQQELDTVFERARKALNIIETYDQNRVDRLCQAVAWAVSNKKTFTRLVKEGIEDYDSRMNKRMKIRGVLRDALKQKSVGIIEDIPEKGIVKYGKPAGIIACIVPTTNPDLTPAGNAIYAIKARSWAPTDMVGAALAGFRHVGQQLTKVSKEGRAYDLGRDKSRKREIPFAATGATPFRMNAEATPKSGSRSRTAETFLKRALPVRASNVPALPWADARET